MKKTVKILIPSILAAAIILCTAWYLFIYDRAFTRDLLLDFARYSESRGNHSIAAWFYNRAYSQTAGSDDIAIELADQYKAIGNYTKAEYTLSGAIADGGGVDVYIALSKTYVEQDKILDAVNMLANITNAEVKAQLDALRPAAPVATPAPGFFNQYICATITAEGGKLYVSSTEKYPSIVKDVYTDPIILKDGENTIYAVCVSDNGLVSPLSIFGYTIGGVVELMTFSDEAVEAEVRNLLGVDSSKELYTNDLWTIKSFTMPGNAKDYSDLKHMAFLESLTIENGIADQIGNIASLANLTQLKITGTSLSQSDIADIGALPMLQNLTLQNCSLTSIAGLENATKLVTLDLSNNTIRDIRALSSMKELQELYLQKNAVVDLTPISACTALTTLDISSNAITSLAPVTNVTSLTWLNASTNAVTDLGDIGKLSSLSVLNLNSNKLSNINTLASCAALTDLNVSTNLLTDITALSSLTNLMYFDFSFNEVTELPAFPKDCDLVVINGSNNKLSSLSRLGGLEMLNKVHMDYNANISSVDALANCPRLIEVNVYETKVTSVTKLTNQSIIVNFKPV